MQRKLRREHQIDRFETLHTCRGNFVLRAAGEAHLNIKDRDVAAVMLLNPDRGADGFVAPEFSQCVFQRRRHGLSGTRGASASRPR